MVVSRWTSPKSPNSHGRTRECLVQPVRSADNTCRPKPLTRQQTTPTFTKRPTGTARCDGDPFKLDRRSRMAPTPPPKVEGQTHACCYKSTDRRWPPKETTRAKPPTATTRCDGDPFMLEQSSRMVPTPPPKVEGQTHACGYRSAACGLRRRPPALRPRSHPLAHQQVYTSMYGSD